MLPSRNNWRVAAGGATPKRSSFSGQSAKQIMHDAQQAGYRKPAKPRVDGFPAPNRGAYLDKGDRNTDGVGAELTFNVGTRAAQSPVHPVPPPIWTGKTCKGPTFYPTGR